MENSVAKIERVLQTVIAEQRRMRVREQISRDSKYLSVQYAHTSFGVLLLLTFPLPPTTQTISLSALLLQYYALQ
jgi:hypothetical protein